VAAAAELPGTSHAWCGEAPALLREKPWLSLGNRGHRSRSLGLQGCHSPVLIWEPTGGVPPARKAQVPLCGRGVRQAFLADIGILAR